MVTVKWGKEKITFDQLSPDTPLSTVRSRLAEHTHLAPHTFKLIHAGAVMKDDSVPMSAYKLRPNSVIQLIGSVDFKLPQARPQHNSQSEQSILNAIQSELHVVRNTIQPDLDLFVQAPMNQKEHIRLGEVLLQSLLRFDNILVEPGWEDARRERKGAVKEVQDMLDRLDNAWTTKNAG